MIRVALNGRPIGWRLSRDVQSELGELVQPVFLHHHKEAKTDNSGQCRQFPDSLVHGNPFPVTQSKQWVRAKPSLNGRGGQELQTVRAR